MTQRMTDEAINRWLLEDAMWYHYRNDDLERDKRLFHVMSRVVEEEIVEAKNGKA